MKVLQGFIDIGGQASRYTKAIRLQNEQAKAWFYERTLKQESFDRLLDFSNQGLFSGRLRKLGYLTEVLTNFSHLHIHKGFSLLHKGLDMSVAKKLGKKIVIQYRGSEIRKDMQQVNLEAHVIAKIKRESSIANKILVKDGQLAELIKPYVPRFEVFPNIVDVSVMKGNIKTYRHEGKLRIVHIPSNAKVKGTDYVREQINKIKDQVEYIELTRVSHERVLFEYLNADIVIDQVLTGTYGNTSLEAMALGTAVMAYLNPIYTAYEPEQPPIISVEVSTLCDKVLYYVENRKELENIGKSGKLFVEKYHSYNEVGKKLIELYSLL